MSAAPRVPLTCPRPREGAGNRVPAETAPIRVRRPYGRVEGLRALATLAFALSLAAVSLPALPRFVAADAASVRFDEADQVRLCLAGVLLGFGLLLQAALSASAIASGHRPVGRRVPWALLTIVCGLGVVGVFRLRAWAAAGRNVEGGKADYFLYMLVGATAVTLVAFGVDALTRRPRLLRTRR